MQGGKKMKKKGMFCYGVVCFAVFLLVGADVSSGGVQQMQILNHNFDVDAGPRSQWYPWVDYNAIDNEFMVTLRSSGRQRVDCEPGDEYECENSFHIIHGQRVSPDGVLMGNSLQWSEPAIGWAQVPRIDHNPFSNEYLLAYTYGSDDTGGFTAGCENYVALTDNLGTLLNGPNRVYEKGEDGNALLPVVIFNPLEQEYLTVVTDRDVFNDYSNNVGHIFDEEGNTAHGPLRVGSQAGDTWATLGVHNPTDNTYFVVWEDFRNTNDWTLPAEVYGAVLDAEGNMIQEIAIMDDFGMEDAGDQRVPNVAYNPDKDEFFVVWEVKKFALDEPGIIGSGIVGRFIDSDGSLKGEPFTVVDKPRIQHWPSIVYVEEEKKYFMSWTDTRNDGLPPGDPWYFSEKTDIYAGWFDDSGRQIGDDIALCDCEGKQSSGVVSYNPLMKRFLVTWYDRNAQNDWGIVNPNPSDPFGEIPSDVRATIYGMPAFLTVQVVEGGTGTPVEGALALVVGPSLPAFRQTTMGGWFNIEKGFQLNGPYLVMVFKSGYQMALELVNYTGEPQEVTVTMNP
jgi:hypothetical protein